ncbi:hypothetical protein K505DRAFT_377835 [Melanomma pulvis-pyrius CBS 109.77]|uniref:Uncharacterized protein n=1 Tax=Melanomma pulvis-pyrius CBS 109.77 TaxID=1314802 RepID=A0A6A6X0W5_9PLEO|nr:hypothetical protein K505DRAFT_377835 [Melanomma pulvis-pyrius CBS 109.77]
MEPQTKKSARKRKAINYSEDETGYPIWDEDAPLKKSKTLTSTDTSAVIENAETEPSPNKSSTKREKKATDDDAKIDEERRLRRFRKHAPQSYLEVKGRALTQRLTILDRERCGTDSVPEETIMMAGSTGNVYTQHIGRVPSCDCMHAKKGNQCKHIIYVMLRVLKAPENIGYQLALTSSELQELFKNAAPIPAADAEAASGDGNRKPIEGECPICYCEFEITESKNIVYCKAACGNNVHKDCMASWATAKRGKATCPYCRAAWAEEECSGKVDLQGATRNQEGYLNVAKQLGLSGKRDTSTYHPHWVNRRYRHRGGYNEYDDYGD